MLYFTISVGTKTDRNVATGLTLHLENGQTLEISPGKGDSIVIQVPADENEPAPARLCIHPGASNVVALEVIEGARGF